MGNVIGDIFSGGITGIFSGAKKEMKANKELKQQAASMKAPEVPSAIVAQKNARDNLVKQRQSILAQGGQTDVTQGTAQATPGNVKKITLGG
jgi:hypothetical protein